MKNSDVITKKTNTKKIISFIFWFLLPTLFRCTFFILKTVLRGILFFLAQDTNEKTHQAMSCKYKTYQNKGKML